MKNHNNNIIRIL